MRKAKPDQIIVCRLDVPGQFVLCQLDVLKKPFLAGLMTNAITGANPGANR